MRRLVLILGFSVAGAAAVFAGPLLMPAGPGASIDASGALAAGHLWAAAGLVFAGGLLTALTPCVYPLIPITVSVFSGGHVAKQSRTRRAALTGTYVLGIAVFFSAVGVLVARAGVAFGSWLAYPAVQAGMAVFFIAMAASMFGAFELALPQSLALRLNKVGGTGFIGAFTMGLVAGPVAAPCTGPVLAGILLYVGQQHSLALGASLLFLYALGIGVPFFIIGVFSFSLGKSGPWMDAVKSLFGIALLALAAGYLRDAFPAVKAAVSADPRVTYAAAAAVCVGIAIGAVHLSFHSHWREQLLKAAGVALVVVGVAARFGFEGTAEAACLNPSDPGCKAQIVWVKDIAQGLERAKAEHKPAFVDFYADWCGACKELDAKTYPSPIVRAAAARFVPIKVDGTRSSDALDAIYDKYGVEGLPTVIFVDSQGAVMKDPRIVGYVSPAEMVADLAKVK
jgi:thiol:disulfide interchange protein DsbD